MDGGGVEGWMVEWLGGGEVYWVTGEVSGSGVLRGRAETSKSFCHHTL